MKNIFKIAAIALMACPLFLTACTPENTDPEDTTPVTPDPQPQVQASIDLTWDGDAQTLGFKDAYMSTSNPSTENNLYYLDVAKGLNGENYELPEFVFAFWKNGNTLQLTADFNFNVTDPETNETVQRNGNDLFATEVFEQVSVGGYGDYQLYGHIANPVYGAFDATELTYNCTLNLKFYNLVDFATAYQALGLAEDQEPTQAQLQEVWSATTMKNLTLDVVAWPFSATK